MEQWGEGHFQTESAQETHVLNVGAQAKYALLKELREIEFDELRGAFDETAEQVRSPSAGPRGSD